MIYKEIQFPLRGSIADIALVIEWIIILLYLEVALIFLNRVFKFKKELKSLQERGYAYLYLGFSIMWIFFILADHYVQSSQLRLIFLNCGYISLMLGALLFIYIIESYKIFLKRYLFTLIFTLEIIIFVVTIIYDIDYGQLISFIFWPIFVLFFIFYSLELNSIFKSNPILGKFKYKYLQLVIGIILSIFGFGLTIDFIINLLGLIYRIVGDFLQIFALAFLFSFFLSIPSFSEYDWQEKVENLFIIHKSGLLIYEKSFIDDDKQSFGSSVSGVITSIRMMLEQISEADDISIIEKKGKYIIIQPGHYIYGVLISEEKLISLHVLLNNLIEKIEVIYHNILQNWDGDLTVFQPLDKMIQGYFL
ncbi:MAG: hypothetical protein ACFFCI_00330 [Promethearchaeota archaeon]